MKKKAWFPLILLLFFCSAFAQNETAGDITQIRQGLEKLRVLGSVMYIGAHPDDESNHVLAYLATGRKYKTAYLSMNRGSGGQNLIGEEQSPYIGIMRTEELLKARSVDGARQLFTRAFDFGFSKSAEETFRFWGHDRILSDVVWNIRRFRPDILIARFPEDKRAGHGNHWASAILAHEAFFAAADSTRFPEQLNYVEVWQPKRLLWDSTTFNFQTMAYQNKIKEGASDKLAINIGGIDPLVGKDYGQLAAESRSMHKSQGVGAAATKGDFWEYFKTLEGTPPTETLMDGINTTWQRIEGGEQIGILVQQANEAFSPDHPDKIVPLLLKIRKAIKDIRDPGWRNEKLKEVDNLILSCSRLEIGAYLNQPYVVAGQPVQIQTELIKGGENPVRINAVSIFGKEKNISKELVKNSLEKESFEEAIPDNIPVSQPYWLRKPHASGYYHIPDQWLVGRPLNPPVLRVKFNLDFDGEIIPVTEPINYRYTDPVKGEVLDAVVVTPLVTANIENEIYVFNTAERQPVHVKLKAFKDHVSGIATLQVPEGFQVPDNNQPFELASNGDEKDLTFDLQPAGPVEISKLDSLFVRVKVGNQYFDKGIKIIDYPHIPKITVFPVAEAGLVSLNMKTEGKQIGYIMGAGDKVPGMLSSIGYQVRLLEEKDLTTANLRQFDAVVVGIRAYNTRPDLKFHEDALLNYVKEGGVLVVQYNTTLNLQTRHLGPYPFEVVRDRVTEEDAKVTFLLPHDPVLNVPNKITEADFKGWVQERGLYFVDHIDSRYRKPLSMHDTGEAPMDNSLIVTDYGKGKYVYTGLAFFRQLPAGVPGAFRLFANLLAKEK